MKKRVFSGVRPTGPLHIGNYLAAVQNWVKLQDQYQCVFCVVDLHALTTPKSSKNLPKKIFDLTTTILAAGIDPKKCLLFVQSQVPEHTELTWLLNTITKIPELERMTQYKEKSRELKSNLNAGLFTYPVLMAADILLYQTNAVPVGEDQKQHVELARTLARRFNNLYGKTFTLPEAFLVKEAARVKALDNPEKKMSKSNTSPSSVIELTDSPADIKDKVKKAVTDSGKEIKYEPARPAIANLMDIYHCFSGLSFNQIEKKYQGKGYAQFKEDLAEIIIKELTPFQKKKKALVQKPSQVKNILDKGAREARKTAQKTLAEARKRMGLI